MHLNSEIEPLLTQLQFVVIVLISALQSRHCISPFLTDLELLQGLSSNFCLYVLMKTKHQLCVIVFSTRVSNELGAGNPLVARMAVWAALFLSSIEAVIVSTVLFSCRHVLGYAYSNDKQVVQYIAAMTPLICLSVITDSLQAVFSGGFLVLLSRIIFV